MWKIESNRVKIEICDMLQYDVIGKYKQFKDCCSDDSYFRNSILLNERFNKTERKEYIFDKSKFNSVKEKIALYASSI